MIRGELDGTRLERLAHNFRNPYEIAVSSFGEAYCSDNDNDGNFSVRICWILEGGDYGWFGGPPFPKEQLDVLAPPGTPFREAWHFRGHIPGHVPGTLVTGFGSPCGMCFYEGDAFGPDYRGAPIHADAGPREVRIYRHQTAGYGMQATTENVVTTDGDNYFRPDDVCAAPDGSLYVADWYDGGVGGHAYNDPERGRIFRLTPAGGQPQRVGKPGPYANLADAIEGLQNPNLATQYLAREKLLAAGEASVEALLSLMEAGDPVVRARALWVLDRIGGAARDRVVAELVSRDAGFRALAVRILRRHGEQYAAEILTLAGDDSAEVRREVVLALAHLEGESALDALSALAATYDGTDRYQLEALNIAAGERKAELFARLDAAGTWSLRKLPLMQLLNPEAATAFLNQALAASGLDAETGRALLEVAGNAASADAGRTILQLLANDQVDAELRELALARLSANLAGPWRDLTGDEGLLATLRGLLGDQRLVLPVLRTIGERGLTGLAPDVQGLVADTAAADELRAEAIAVAVSLRLDDLAGMLIEQLAGGSPAVREAIVDALVDLQDARALRGLLADGAADDALQARAVERLMTSTGGAIVLLRLVDSAELPAALQERAVALAEGHVDANVRVLFERFIPEDRRPQRLGEAIRPAEILALEGDSARGERIFFQSSAAQCKNCHRVAGTGATLGPDLSLIGKKYERAALLETILDPSKAIAPEYIPYLVETDAGQVYAGFLVERTDEQVVLRDAKNQLIRVPAGEVVALARQQKSLMPELVLRDVTAQDAADLLAYLSSLQQGVLHVDRFRVLGPFDSSDGQGLDRDYGIESALADVDLAAEHPGLAGQTNRWEEVPTRDHGGFLALDQVQYCQSRQLPTDKVACYYLVYADSAADQQSTLLIGSDDSVRVWVNGEEVHRWQGSRAVGYAQDRVAAALRAGRNTIVLKVENTNGPGGVALSIAAPATVEVKTR
jgi:putative heme-binding domain-containing protein